MPLRGGLIKSRGACKTCRIRHLKCDETRPVCSRCQNDGHRCDGYHTSTKSHPSHIRSAQSLGARVPSALPTLPAFDDPLQRELFASFVSCTTDSSTFFFGANFWARRVLQLSLSERSILYALCSLSALHRISMKTPTDMASRALEMRHYALQQYNQAVRCTQALLEESSDGSEEKLIKGLVTCALFVCYENFIGNYEVSHMHLQNGLQIITKESRKQFHRNIPKDIVQVFKRLDLQAITFGDARIPYPDELCKGHIDILTTQTTGFGSIEDSLDVILHLCRWMFRREAYSNVCPVSSEELKSAKKALESWNVEVEHCFLIPHVGVKDKLPHPIALLKMYQIIMTIIIVTGVSGHETLHDNYIDKYEEILALAESLLLGGGATLSAAATNRFFSFDIGVIFPLFWVAIKLRKPQSRRRAVKLLSSMYHQEGAWKSTSAAKVAQFVIDIEEEGMLQDDCHIPELSRVHLVNTTADVKTGEICVSCVMRSATDHSSWYAREGRVSDGTRFLHS